MKAFFLTPHKKCKDVTKDMLLTNKSKIYEIPSVIKVNRMSTPDMNNIHSCAIKYFHNKYSDIDNIKANIRKYKAELETRLTYIERRDILSKIDDLEEKLDDIVNEKSKSKYIVEITPIMNKYKELQSIQTKTIFGSTNNDDDDEVTKYMLMFLETVRKYTGISFNFEIPSKYECVECYFDLTNVIPDLDGSIRCPQCRIENESNRCPKMLMAFNKSLNIHHGDYSERTNFYKFIIRFQGKYEPTISDTLWKKLDDYFTKEKRPIGEVIRREPRNYKGYKDNTSLSLMLSALCYYGYSMYYDDVYVICQKYWGWELADFKEDENVIMYIYDITQPAYARIENKTRTSSISIPFIAFKITEMLNYPYEVCDFKIPKDDKSREETEYYWKLSCLGCGDPEVVYIPTRKY